MGVLYDYFRAPGPAEVRRHLDENEGSSPAEVFDSVDLKMIDPGVALSQLLEFATGRKAPDRERLIWPVGVADDPDYMGPWVTVLADEARDILAAIPAGRVSGLAERWTGIEEFSGFLDAEFLSGVLTDLSALAVRARAQGESLYCWCCL